MWPKFCFRFLLLTLLLIEIGLADAVPAKAYQQETPQPARLDAPAGGDALQGVVAIKGSSAAPGFRSAEIAFAYQNNPTGTWFLIQQSSLPVQDGALASWDTSTIADGVYRLRLQVYLQGGQVLQTEVTGLRVRNYSPIETSTPGSVGAVQPANAPATPTPTVPDFQPTAYVGTPLPTNPAEVTPRDMQSSALQGVAVVIGGLVIFGIYLGVRALARR